MSDKDFARLESPGFPNEGNHQPANSRSTLIVILSLAIAIISFSAGFFVGEQYGLESSKGNKHAALIEQLQNQQKELETLKQDAKKNKQQEVRTSQVGELTFYNELPKQSIVPEALDGSKIELPSTTPKAHAVISSETENIKAVEQKLDDIIARELSTPTKKFRIQIASFIQRKDAEALVSQLKEISINATIHRVSLDKLGDRFRVYTTAFDNQEKAMHAKQLVHDRFGITGIVISE